MTEQQRQAIVQSLVDEERTRCEIWTRVMGYHRPTTSYNPGKLQEFIDRKRFREPLGT